MQPITEPMEVEMEHLHNTILPQATPSSSKPKPSKKSHGRITRSQIVGKGNLEDSLQAIDIEETLVVKVVEVKGGKKKKKGLTAKKLDFSSEDAGFVFKPRNPRTMLKLAKVTKVEKKTKEIEKGKQPMVEDSIDLSPTKE